MNARTDAIAPSPEAVAAAFDLPWPEAKDLAEDLKRVLSAAILIQPDAQQAVSLIRKQSIPCFRHKTLLQLVREGRTEDAIGYLGSISAGFVG